MKAFRVNTRKTRVYDSMDKVEYLYVCDKCDMKLWHGSKRLYARCPSCRDKGIKSKMEMHA